MNPCFCSQDSSRSSDFAFNLFPSPTRPHLYSSPTINKDALSTDGEDPGVEEGEEVVEMAFMVDVKGVAMVLVDICSSGSEVVP